MTSPLQSSPDIRYPTGDDIAWMLDLNNAHARELSWLTADELQDMTVMAAHVAVLAPVAFVLCFDQDAPYSSPNFAWHRKRFDRFRYVDRVVVDPAARGTGIARRLYGGVFASAAADGIPRVVAEINADPPNPASSAFHTRLGFVEVGQARLADRNKVVRYVAADVPL